MRDRISFLTAVTVVASRIPTDRENAVRLLSEAIGEGIVTARIKSSGTPAADDPQALYDAERTVLLRHLGGLDIRTDEFQMFPYTQEVDRSTLETWLRALQPRQEALDLHVGLPGAPEKGRTAIIAEFNRRLDSGETCEGVAAEAKALINWFAKAYPDAKRPKPKSTENLIRAAFRNRTPIEA